MIDVRMVAQRLAQDPIAVCSALGLDGKREGNEYKVEIGSYGKVCIVLKGAKQGVCLFTAGTGPNGKAGGDMLTVAEAMEGDFKSAIRWAAGYLGIADAQELDPQRQADMRVKAEHAARAREKAAERQNEKKALRALDLWDASVALVKTPGETYFRNRVQNIPADFQWPDALRFNPRCLWNAGGAEQYHPAVVCRVDDENGKLCAVWRIFIKPDGSGKADLTPNKMGFGPAGGGAVRLWQPVNGEIGACEGVETAFGAHLMTGKPVWAMLSTSGLTGFQCPWDVTRVRGFPDGDVPKRNDKGQWLPSPGISSMTLMCERLKAEGAFAVMEPSPGPGLDYLDLWNKAQNIRRVA